MAGKTSVRNGNAAENPPFKSPQRGPQPASHVVRDEPQADDEKKPLKPFVGPLAPLKIRPVPRPTRRAPPAEKAFSCAMCFKGVGTKGGLRYHIQAHLNGRRFKCDKCEKSYATKNDFDTHYKRHFDNFSCDFCDRKFLAKDYIRTHISALHLPKVIPCVGCCKKPKYFSSKLELAKHKRSKTKSIKNLIVKFECKLCKMDFYNKVAYKKHCELRETLKYECKVCREKFTCYKLYQAHALKEKTGRYCELCKIVVFNLATHTRSYHNFLKCDVCDFKTTNRVYYYVHLKKCGTEAQIRALGHQCQECGSFFRTKSLLEAHANQKHVNYKCEFCGRGYNTETKYRRHLRGHIRKARKGDIYRCIICVPNKYFSAKGGFDKHFDHSHSRSGRNMLPGAGRVFVCGVCEKRTFTAKERLVMHIMRGCLK